MKKKRKGKERKRERGRRWPEWGLLTGVVVARGAGGDGRWLGAAWSSATKEKKKKRKKGKKKRRKKKKRKRIKKKRGIDGVMDGRGIKGGGVVSPTWRGVDWSRWKKRKGKKERKKRRD